MPFDGERTGLHPNGRRQLIRRREVHVHLDGGSQIPEVREVASHHLREIGVEQVHEQAVGPGLPQLIHQGGWRVVS